jgi:hypothetical protein
MTTGPSAFLSDVTQALADLNVSVSNAVDLAVQVSWDEVE